MHFKTLALSAFAATASAQSLAQVLSNQSSLSNLTTYLSLFPTFESSLASLSNITLLAPNNNAFEAFLNSSSGSAVANDTSLIEALFSYHVLNGSYSNFTGIQFIPTALMSSQYSNVSSGQVVEAVGDGNTTTFYSGLLQNATTNGTTLNFTNGVIHIIDSFLTIPENISETAIELGLSSAVGALEAANLVETVNDLSNVTCFVPNNDAFQSIASALATLPIQNLTEILEYHVVNGTIGYSTMLSNMTLKTLSGLNLGIKVDNGSVYVNNAKVIYPNVLVANGVVHVIDEVLNPQNVTATAKPSQSSGYPAYSGASSGSNAPYTSGVPTPTSSISYPSITAAGTSAGSGSVAGSSSSSAGAMPMKTGAVGAAALFGAGAIVMNL